jgi:hypothetical protein
MGVLEFLHRIVDYVFKLFRSIPGDYYQVDPVALQSDVDILTRNRSSSSLRQRSLVMSCLWLSVQRMWDLSSEYQSEPKHCGGC